MDMVKWYVSHGNVLKQFFEGFEPYLKQKHNYVESMDLRFGQDSLHGNHFKLG